jgi:hypothetical protein
MAGDPPVSHPEPEPDNDDFGPTEGVSDQQPEEAQREAVPEGSDPDRGKDQRDA